MTRSAATTLVLTTLLLSACQQQLWEGDPESGAAAASATEIIGPLRADDPVSFRLKADQRIHGYMFYAAAGTSVNLDASWPQAGGVPMALRVLGPRNAEGTYPAEAAPVNPSNPGRVRALTFANAGWYLAELAITADASATFEPVPYSLVLQCNGSCEAPTPIGTMGLETHWYRNAAESVVASLQAYRLAGQQLPERIRSSAGEGPWTIVSDLDETVLDNSQYQKERAELGLGYSAGAWTAWVRRREAAVLPGTVEFFRRVHELGGRVAFVSNRTAEECPDTEANLREQGIEPDAVLCRVDTKEKEPRFAMVENGTAATDFPASRIMMFLGDNIEDFPGLDQTTALADGALDDFGTRYVLLPNPMYGSFVNNPRN